MILLGLGRVACHVEILVPVLINASSCLFTAVVMQVTYLSALLEKVMFSVISKEISTLNSVCCSIGELVL